MGIYVYVNYVVCMKILIITSPNSLSHILKAKSIGKSLIENGHEIHYATTPKYAHCFKQRFHPIPDIQESDLSPFPTFSWYSSETNIKNCIKAELTLIENIKPDLIIGIFRFTTRTAAKLTNVPFYSVASGCILPNQKTTLGFNNNEENNQNQRYYLKCFNEFATHKLNKVHKSLGAKTTDNILNQLTGDMTFLWDFKDFFNPNANYPHQHIGPIEVSNLLPTETNFTKIENNSLPKVLISLGTCNTSTEFISRMVNIMLDLGFAVILCQGKNKNLKERFSNNSNVFCYEFIHFKQALEFCDLVICHGGQLTLFEAFEKQVPALIFPFHPEQAQNGICAESINCGQRIIDSTVFTGDSNVYINRFMLLSDDEIKQKISDLVTNPKSKKALKKISKVIKELPGETAIADYINKVA